MYFLIGGALLRASLTTLAAGRRIALMLWVLR